MSIFGSFTLTVDVDGASPQFTLTCISTGGPATIVSWTRDTTPVTEGNETVLVNPITAEYLHTLKVTGDIKGRYTCTVANNKPSNASVTIECEGGCMHSTCDGLSSIVAIVIVATAGTILLSICAIGLLCVKGFCSDSSPKNTGKRFLTGVDNLLV